MAEAALPRLILITDGVLTPVRRERLAAVLALGSRIGVQLRRPNAPVRALLEDAWRLHALCAPHSNPLFVNGRLDVALRVGAHLHLPAQGLLPSDVRPHLPRGRWLGCAVHSEAEARESAGANLILVSPVFAPGSKPGDSRPPLGIEGFRALARLVSCPAYGLGGIHPTRAELLKGMAGAATVSGVLDAEDAVSAARTLLAALHV